MRPSRLFSPVALIMFAACAGPATVTEPPQAIAASTSASTISLTVNNGTGYVREYSGTSPVGPIGNVTTTVEWQSDHMAVNGCCVDTTFTLVLSGIPGVGTHSYLAPAPRIFRAGHAGQLEFVENQDDEARLSLFTGNVFPGKELVQTGEAMLDVIEFIAPTPGSAGFIRGRLEFTAIEYSRLYAPNGVMHIVPLDGSVRVTVAFEQQMKWEAIRIGRR